MVERIYPDRMYEVWEGYYLKIDASGVIRILYNKQPIIFDVHEYFTRLQNLKNLGNKVFEGRGGEILEQVDEVDKTNLTANQYIRMSIKELNEVLKEFEEKEDYEKCVEIRELIKYKKEERDAKKGNN